MFFLDTKDIDPAIFKTPLPTDQTVGFLLSKKPDEIPVDTQIFVDWVLTTAIPVLERSNPSRVPTDIDERILFLSQTHNADINTDVHRDCAPGLVTRILLGVLDESTTAGTMQPRSRQSLEQYRTSDVRNLPPEIVNAHFVSAPNKFATVLDLGHEYHAGPFIRGKLKRLHMATISVGSIATLHELYGRIDRKLYVPQDNRVVAPDFQQLN